MARATRTAGWIQIPRGWMWDPVFQPAEFTEREAYLWSMEEAAFSDHDQWFNRMPIPVRRGEFVSSVPVMARTFGWSAKRVRLFLDRMIRAGKWAKRKAYAGAKAPTVIIICQYNEIQATPANKGKAGGASPRISAVPSGQSEGKGQKDLEKNGENGLACLAERLAEHEEWNRRMGRS